MQTEFPAERKLPWRKIVAAGLVLLVLGVLVLRGVDVRARVNEGMSLIETAGPVAFFLAMALLPAAGVPMMVFLLTAGPAFGRGLGSPMVFALSLLAVGVNFTFSYWLARGAFKPLLSKLFVKLGYKMPQAEAEDAVDLVIICRVTPGIPFCVQNYLCGLANIPFRKYLLVSCVIVFPLSSAFILFGDALLQGRGKVALIALSLLMAFSAMTHLIRKHYRKRKLPT